MPTPRREKPNDPPGELEQLLQRAGQGSQEAKLELFRKYARHLLHIIRHKLNSAQRLRSIYDSDEFVQDVGKALFTQEVPQGVFESPQTFIAFMIGVARNRVARWCASTCKRKNTT